MSCTADSSVIEERSHPLLYSKQKTAYEMRISDWSSDVCSSDLRRLFPQRRGECGACDPAVHALRAAGRAVFRVEADEPDLQPERDVWILTSMQRLESRPTGPRAAFAAWLAAVAPALAAFAVPGPPRAQLHDDITQGLVQPTPIPMP